MRRLHPTALLVGLACLLGFSNGARAGVTIDLVFQDATTPSGLTIDAGDPGPGCTFDNYGAFWSVGHCTDLMLYTTVPLIGLGVGVQYDSDNGLAVLDMREWMGVGVSFNEQGTLQKSCSPPGGLVDNGGRLEWFDCVIAPPNAPPQMPAGTYKIGTIIWDTSGIVAGGDGKEWISTVFDWYGGVIAVINGNIVDVSASVVLGSHAFTIIPEPGTAALLGLGFVGLLLAARRRRPSQI